MSPVVLLLLVILGIIVVWIVVQQIWVGVQLSRVNIKGNLAAQLNTAPRGVSAEQRTETEQYTRLSKIEDGIEWISYLPKQKTHETPILMQHGMWHGAWCWQQWQEILAAQGWESHAISLPGHGNSPVQRPIRKCTLDYYLPFIRDAVNKLPTLPVLMGHSMGGALTQWYLRYVGNLPAAVLVAPWALYGGFLDSAMTFFIGDPIGCVMTSIKYQAEFVRSPWAADRALTSKGAIYSPEELYKRLGPESALVMMQHAMPWEIPPRLNTPILYLSGEIDAVIPKRAQRRAAAGYKADYVMVEKAAHNLMMEHNYRETADKIAAWLKDHVK